MEDEDNENLNNYKIIIKRELDENKRQNYVILMNKRCYYLKNYSIDKEVSKIQMVTTLGHFYFRHHMLEILTLIKF